MNNIKTLAILSLVSLSSCMSYHATKTEIKTSPFKTENLILNKNYQELLKCWDDNGEKVPIDFKNATISQIYVELGVAEITVPAGDNRFFMLAELKKLSKDKTLINIYGQDYIGSTTVPKWTETFKKCADSN